MVCLGGLVVPCEVVQLLRQTESSTVEVKKVPCALHPLHQECSSWKVSPGKISGHIAGVQCQDWSGMGKHSGWSGRTCTSFLAWLLMRLERDEDYVIIENVCSFPVDEIEALLGSRFSMRVLMITPVMGGMPVNRRRMYMLLINKARWQWRKGLGDDQSCQEAYEALFTEPCVLTGEDMCRAPPELILSHRETSAVARGMPRKRLRGEEPALVGSQLSSPIRSFCKMGTQHFVNIVHRPQTPLNPAFL